MKTLVVLVKTAPGVEKVGSRNLSGLCHEKEGWKTIFLKIYQTAINY
jgi:hypothetical protein